MRIAYFDCSYGVAGDMILGALVDAGASFDEIRDVIEKGLGIEGIVLRREAVRRAGVVGTRVHVEVDTSHDKHRHLADVEAIIGNATISERVRAASLAAYRRLAEAEAKVHGSTPEKIHFHEVGCLDAIADVTGSMLAMELLGIDQVVVSTISVGSGTARMAHGVLPVPAPATVELLRGMTFQTGPFDFEMATPTGVAILASQAVSSGMLPPMALETSGYGAGKREVEGHPNYLRVLIGGGERNPADGKPWHQSRLVLLMTEIDDMNPELFGDLMDHLFQSGCLDAHFTPIQMKKNRPGTQLQVLCSPGDQDALIELILHRSSTFGVKIIPLDRACLPRRKETLATAYGEIEVKVALWNGEILKVTPEYESCRALSHRVGIALIDIYREAEASIRTRYKIPAILPEKKT